MAKQYDTPKAQEGIWTLIAPDGRTWRADTPLKCCSIEMRERVPASVALARIQAELAADEPSVEIERLERELIDAKQACNDEQRLRLAAERAAPEIAAALAHRVCGGEEHDVTAGKLHGCCIVCLVPWPCETARHFLRADEPSVGPVPQATVLLYEGKTDG